LALAARVIREDLETLTLRNLLEDTNPPLALPAAPPASAVD
jgi:hypothetical protein